jgi:hypothetical protein
MADQVVTLVESAPLAGDVHKIKWTWKSATGGAVSSATTNRYTGQLLEVVFDPDAAGTQPTDAYDVTILDGDGVDVLNGNGANLSNAANVMKVQSDGLGCVESSTLTLTIANAGDEKGGVAILYLLNLG